MVLHELLAGANTAAKGRQVTRQIARPFKRTDRLVAPMHGAWEIGGKVLALMASEEGLALKRAPKSLVNDVLLAASCRESGLVLITGNQGDFARIRRYIVRFYPPLARLSGFAEPKALFF